MQPTNLKHRIHTLKLRHKFAALGVVAVAMVATPLVQVLRYQSAEIQAALYEQAGLDPVSGAVTLQNALLAHRDIAGLVLRGVLQLEPERSLRQTEVDVRAAHLEATLLSLTLPRAVTEAQALRQDWVTLVPQVEQRKISPLNSDAAHRLLIEQTLQVIDLVASVSGLDSHGSARTYLASVRDLTALPHVTAQIAALGLPTDSSADPGEVAAAEAALARALGHLSEGLNRGALADPGLVDAVASAGVTADRLFQLRRQGDAPEATALATATASALQAQARLFDAANQSVRRALDVRVQRVESQRAGLMLLMGALALLALGLLRSVQGQLASKKVHGTHPARSGFDDEPDGQTLHRDVAGRLWQRLRHDEPGSAGPQASADAPMNLPDKDGHP